MANCRTCGNELPEDAKFCPRCGTPVSKPEEPLVAAALSQTTATSGPVLAFWEERFLAWLIDVVIVGAFAGILNLFVVLIGAPFVFTAVSGFPSWVAFFISFDLTGVFRFLYWMVMEGSRGQSFGKMVMRIKVVHLDGAPVNMGNAVVESIGKAFFLPLDLLIGWLSYPRKRQRIFNYLSRTIVVKTA